MYSQNFKINFKKLRKIFPLYRHFEIIEHENIKYIGENIYFITNRNEGFNGHLNLPNAIINKVLHNEVSNNLNRSPVFCRFDISSGANSKPSTGMYYFVIPIGEFKIYQSNMIEDLGYEYLISNINLNNDFIRYCRKNIPENWEEIVSSIANSYHETSLTKNTHEVLLDCAEYLLVPMEISIQR